MTGHLHWWGTCALLSGLLGGCFAKPQSLGDSGEGQTDGAQTDGAMTGDATSGGAMSEESGLQGADDTPGTDGQEGDATSDDSGCAPSLEAAPVPELPSDVIIAVDPEWPAPNGYDAVSAALQSVDDAWAEHNVQVAIVSLPMLHQPLHDPTCDSCGQDCMPRSVHAWYEGMQPPDLGVTDALSVFENDGSLECIRRDGAASTQHYVLFTGRDPAGEAGQYEALASTIARSQRTRFHLAYTSGCFGPAGGTSFEGTSIDSGGLSVDVCGDDIGEFLGRIGRPRWGCRWPAGPDAERLQAMLATDAVGDDHVEISRVQPTACDDGQELQFSVFGDEAVLCPVACEWLQSVPVEDYTVQHVLDCAE